MDGARDLGYMFTGHEHWKMDPARLEKCASTFERGVAKFPQDRVLALVEKLIMLRVLAAFNEVLVAPARESWRIHQEKKRKAELEEKARTEGGGADRPA